MLKTVRCFNFNLWLLRESAMMERLDQEPGRGGGGRLGSGFNPATNNYCDLGITTLSLWVCFLFCNMKVLHYVSDFHAIFQSLFKWNLTWEAQYEKQKKSCFGLKGKWFLPILCTWSFHFPMSLKFIWHSEYNLWPMNSAHDPWSSF